jgi:hypothetical protein
MRRHVLARRSGIALGVTYVLLGVAETIRLVVTGDGGFFLLVRNARRGWHAAAPRRAAAPGLFGGAD